MLDLAVDIAALIVAAIVIWEFFVANKKNPFLIPSPTAGIKKTFQLASEANSPLPS